MRLRGPRELQLALVGWLDDRYPFSKSVDEELYRRVPNYAAAFSYYLGGMVFILIILEFLTGFLLGLYYVPDATGNPAPAYTSVHFIQNSAYLGWLIRGIHFWGANLLIVLTLLHLVRVYWTGSYRAPRELNWMVGVIMFLIILVFAITGELLPWDTKTYLARSRELSILSGTSALPPQVSAFLKYVLQGGPIVGPATLQRFFMLHVFLLPALISLLMYSHFRFVRKDGVSEPIEATRWISSRLQVAITGERSDDVIIAADAPVTELEPDAGKTLEPESKRLPIGRDHFLYPMLAGLALFGILIGSTGHHIADDMPDRDTHPSFPDHFWPYPVITVVMLVALGLLAAFAQKNLQLDAPADPRAVSIPHADWYFLFLFQFVKLGPQLITSLVIPLIAVIALIFWPVIDSSVGPRIARRLGWTEWPVPGRNAIAATALVAIFAFLALLTLWALAGPQFCLPWFTSNAVCGA